ncbi:hypothetical protein AVEN_173598-1 [Araneus ventricosus]|uniref:Uncharacterized protein n=1 Tax=Araneus ventricosus TaxID=182803 RepID=A0A4Y2CR38_ARAVE|nr:hypothetical protein AVEN_173598-1 [Araneus ventricosus]
MSSMSSPKTAPRESISPLAPGRYAADAFYISSQNRRFGIRNGLKDGEELFRRYSLLATHFEGMEEQWKVEELSRTPPSNLNQ